jgi:queuine tRNA-ribosyltransferase
MILTNTYHLYPRPRIEVIEGLGGLHQFMSWGRPILTDSGGYQLFSLTSLCRVSEEGVLFRSHIDGSEHRLTPELVIQLQEKLEGDTITALDDRPPYSRDVTRVREAMERTYRWAQRCRQSHRREDQALYGVVQEGIA